MPQMGESIFEGIITKWLKSVGDKVQRDEPLFEISTDKVDAEIPAPAEGMLTEIKAPAGTTVQVNSVVAVIGGPGAAANAGVPSSPSCWEAGRLDREADSSAPGKVPHSRSPDRGGGRRSLRRRAEVRSSPLVRKLAKEHGVIWRT